MKIKKDKLAIIGGVLLLVGCSNIKAQEQGQEETRSYSNGRVAYNLEVELQTIRTEEKIKQQTEQRIEELEQQKIEQAKAEEAERKKALEKQSYTSSNNTSNNSGNATWSCGLGSIGAIKVGGYQAQLNYVNYGDASMQAVTDAYNSCLYTYVNSITYIADHNYQGFSAIMSNDTMQIMWSDGSVSTYYKRATYYTGTDGYTEYGHIFDIESGICTQTCVGDGYVFVMWS